MARRSLRPHLNQIRGWVRQGRTDAWIAHQLEVTVQDIEAFKRQNELLPDGEAPEGPALDFDDEIDLRAEDDAAIAAELEAAEAARQEEERRAAEEEAAAEEAARGRGAARRAEAGEDEEESDERRRRRGRRRGAQAAAPRATRRARAPQGRRGVRARGHVRPRRGGLRALARPRRRRQRRVRRALGGPPPRGRHDRGGPDRDPPRRRGRRRRRRRLTRPSSRAALAFGRRQLRDVQRAVDRRTPSARRSSTPACRARTS